MKKNSGNMGRKSTFMVETVSLMYLFLTIVTIGNILNVNTKVFLYFFGLSGFFHGRNCIGSPDSHDGTLYQVTVPVDLF
jgi:hypothetical protein